MSDTQREIKRREACLYSVMNIKILFQKWSNKVKIIHNHVTEYIGYNLYGTIKINGIKKTR
jgi:hypothetical protein